jgi:hypothetical protein
MYRETFAIYFRSLKVVVASLQSEIIVKGKGKVQNIFPSYLSSLNLTPPPPVPPPPPFYLV